MSYYLLVRTAVIKDMDNTCVKVQKKNLEHEFIAGKMENVVVALEKFGSSFKYQT